MKKLAIASIFLILLSFKTYEIEGNGDIQNDKRYDLLGFSPGNLYEYICYLGFKDPFFVYKQSILETGGFASGLYKRTNNLFGMHKAYKRPTSADNWIKADHGLYSVYSHWTKSVQDRKLYEDWLLKAYPGVEYKTAIALAGYCPNKHYVRHVENVRVDLKRL